MSRLSPSQYLNRYLGLFIFLWSSHLWARTDISKIWKNNEAVEMQGNKKVVESFEEFAKLLGEDPFNPIFQFNMGTGFLTTQDKEKSKKLFEQLDSDSNLSPELKFFVSYNLGVINGADGQVDAAIDYYQNALEFQPQSKEIKTNIELLIQQKKQGGKKGKKDKKKKKGDSDQKKKQDGEGDPDDEKKDEGDKEPQKMKNQNPGYKGKDMSKEDVKKILNELKNQEQRIRAKHDRKGKKEKDREKNW